MQRFRYMVDSQEDVFCVNLVKIMVYFVSEIKFKIHWLDAVAMKSKTNLRKKQGKK